MEATLAGLEAQRDVAVSLQQVTALDNERLNAANQGLAGELAEAREQIDDLTRALRSRPGLARSTGIGLF